MNPIKTIYQFCLTIQILSLIVFLGYLIESGIDLVVPINIQFNPTYKFTINFRFNYITIISFLLVTGLIYILSGITVLGNGLNDESVITIRKYISFLAQFTILLTPILYIFAISTTLNEYALAITLVLLIVHFLHFLEKEKSDGGQI